MSPRPSRSRRSPRWNYLRLYRPTILKLKDKKNCSHLHRLVQTPRNRIRNHLYIEHLEPQFLVCSRHTMNDKELVNQRPNDLELEKI